MNAPVRKKPAGKKLAIRFDETDPESLAGQYMRRFWHPIYIAADLEPGKFHHVSFLLESWNDVGYAADLIAGKSAACLMHRPQ